MSSRRRGGDNEEEEEEDDDKTKMKRKMKMKKRDEERVGKKEQNRPSICGAAALNDRSSRTWGSLLRSRRPRGKS